VTALEHHRFERPRKLIQRESTEEWAEGSPKMVPARLGDRQQVVSISI
jgi:hypothetical protein